MIVKCTSCETTLRVDDTKSNQESLIVQCPKCSQKLRIRLPKNITENHNPPDPNTIFIENTLEQAKDIVINCIIIIGGKIQNEDELSIKWYYPDKKVDIDCYTNFKRGNEITTIKTIAIHPKKDKESESLLVKKLYTEILNDIMTILENKNEPVSEGKFTIDTKSTHETIYLPNSIDDNVNIIKEILKDINAQILDETLGLIKWSIQYNEEFIECATYITHISDNSCSATTTAKHPNNHKFDERVAINKLHIPLINDSKSLNYKKLKKLNNFCSNCGQKLNEYNQPINNCPNCGKLISITPKNNYIETNSAQQQTDIFAIIAFASGIGGFVILPIIFVPIGYISALVSYYRIKESNHLKGESLRIIGAILTTINILWLMYQYKIFLKLFNSEL